MLMFDANCVVVHVAQAGCTARDVAMCMYRWCPSAVCRLVTRSTAWHAEVAMLMWQFNRFWRDFGVRAQWVATSSQASCAYLTPFSV